MSTSGSTNFDQTRDQIISDALQLLGRLGEGETASANAITFGASMLNKVVKYFEVKGIHLFTESEGTLFLTQGQNKYTLSLTGDRACDDATLVETTISSDSSGSALTLTTTSGMTAADHIGIILDDDTIQWTTIVSVDSSTTVTITAALTTTASSGNNVFSYTTALDRPLDIYGIRLRNSSGYDRPIYIDGRTEFMDIPNKTHQAPVNRAYYSPQKLYGLLYIWPTPDADLNNRIKFSYSRSIQDFDSAGDNPDLPVEWLYPLTVNLARILAPAYGIDLARKDPTDILNQAAESMAALEAWDSERSSVYIVPDEDC